MTKVRHAEDRVLPPLPEDSPLRYALSRQQSEYLAGNAVNAQTLYRHGRGGYLEGFQYLVDRSDTPVVTFTSDYDFRHRMLLAFYERYLVSERRLEYVDHAHADAIRPMWLLRHGVAYEPPPEPLVVNEATADTYEHVHTIPHSDLAGWTWYIYRRRDR